MFLYLDSFFVEGRDRDVRPLHEIPATLNRLYQLAMREHARPSVISDRMGGRRREFPDWRFDRQVIRLALYLKEELGIETGRRVALVSELRPEWLEADFAIQGLGCVSVALDPAWPAEQLRQALVESDPAVVFVSGAAWPATRALRSALPDVRKIVVLDPDAAGEGDDVALFPAVLDLGGTYDTPERAQPYRAAAREVTPDARTLRHYTASGDGRLTWSELSQGEIIGRIARHWSTHSARRGDVAYMVGPSVTLATRLAGYALIGDGFTTLEVGSTAEAPVDVKQLRPHKVVAPPAVLEAIAAQGEGATEAEERVGLRQLAARLTPAGRAQRQREAARAPFGGRVRWIGPTTPPSDELARRLSVAAAVELDGTPVTWPVPPAGAAR